MLRRALFLFFITVFTLPAFGCTKSSPSGAPSPALPPDMQEHLTISVAYWDIGTHFRKKDPILQKIEKDFNITLDPVQMTMNDYQQKLQTWAASNQLPDVFAHSIASDEPGIYNEWINTKLIKPLPQDLSPYPYVNQIAHIPDIRQLKINNQLYMLPRIAYPTNRLWLLERVILVRKDWMADLLIKEVKSFEQFSNMLISFSNRRQTDLDAPKIVGLTAAGMGDLAWAFSPTFPQFGAGQWVFENSEWIPYYASEKMDQVVTQLRNLYEDGALDKDFYFMRDDDAKNKFAQGYAGAFAYRATPNSLRELELLWNQYNPGQSFYDAVDILHLWPAENGKKYHYVAQTYWSETYFSANASDQKMDRMLKLYDFLLSPEGQLLTTYGIEGIDYKIVDGEIVSNRQVDDATGQAETIQNLYPSLNVLRSIAAWGKESYFRLNETNINHFGKGNIEKSLSEMAWLINNTIATPAYHKINSLSTPAKDKLGSLINPLEDLMKVTISEEDPIELWHSNIANYEALGLRDAIKEVNRELENSR